MRSLIFLAGVLDARIEDLLLDSGVDFELLEDLRGDGLHGLRVVLLLGSLEAGEESSDPVVVPDEN